MRALALRALADRKDQLDGVDPEVFVAALSDPDDPVKIQAINGLVRLGAVEAAGSLIPLTASPDQGLAHLAVGAVARLGAREAALAAVDTASTDVRDGALRALAMMHETPVVSSLLARLQRTQR